MTQFEKRQEGFEKKFALDEEQKFKAFARRNKLLGPVGRREARHYRRRGRAYAKEVVSADFEEAGDDDVLQKVMGDLTAKGVALTEPQVRTKWMS